MLNSLMANHTAAVQKDFEEDTERDFFSYMSAEEACLWFDRLCDLSSRSGRSSTAFSLGLPIRQRRPQVTENTNLYRTDRCTRLTVTMPKPTIHT
jgi:hypothetical protein